MKKYEFDFTIDDFDAADFDDPVKLLDAMKEKRNGFEPSFNINEENVVQNRTVSLSSLFSLEDASRKTGLSCEALRLALIDGSLKCSAYIPLLTQDDINNYFYIQKLSTTPLFEEFMYYIRTTRMLYSYKPLLLLALLSQANENGCAGIDDIIDFFFNFYNRRKSAGLTPEKKESYFVQYPMDRQRAMYTILRYPVKFISEKKYIYYNTIDRTLAFSPQIWSCITSEKKKAIERICTNALEKYYSAIT